MKKNESIRKKPGELVIRLQYDTEEEAKQVYDNYLAIMKFIESNDNETILLKRKEERKGVDKSKQV